MSQLTEDSTDQTVTSVEPRRAFDVRFRKLIATSPDLIAIIDRRGNLAYANPAGERLFAYPGSDYLGQSAIDLVHPDDQERATSALMRDLAEPGTYPADTYRLRVGPNEWRLFEVRATNCLDEPTIDGVVIVGRDVTDAVKDHRTLRMIGDVNRALVHAHDEQRLLAEVCRTIVEIGGYSL